MNIVGINTAHHGSVCYLQNGELTYFEQEERNSRVKYDAFPFKLLIELIQNHPVDYIVLGSTSLKFNSSHIHPQNYWLTLVNKYHPNCKLIDYSDTHHKIHAAHAFYNSGFDHAISLVIDGMGSVIGRDNHLYIQETESIFECKYPSHFEIISKKGWSPNCPLNVGGVYECITRYLGFNQNEEGKTMGLASYGKENNNIPKFFEGSNSVNDVFTPNNYTNSHFNFKNYPNLIRNNNELEELEQDVAWEVQNSTQNAIAAYIEHILKITSTPNIVCSGGYFLNCVTNYYLQKRFPNVNFYFEPVSNDAGIAIGAAKLAHHELNQDTRQRPLQSLYLGKIYDKTDILNTINSYNGNKNR